MELLPLPRIFEATWKAAGCDPMAISKKNPGRTASVFKRTGMYIARMQGYTFAEISKAFELRSHRSAMYAIMSIEEQKTDPMAMEAARLIMKELYGT
jgi:hypothetical protein